MDIRILGLVVGVLGFLASLYIITMCSPVPSTPNEMAYAVSGLAGLATLSPFPGYLIRVLSGRGDYPSQGEYLLTASFGFFIASGALLMIYLENNSWRLFAVVAFLIIAMTTTFSGREPTQRSSKLH